MCYARRESGTFTPPRACATWSPNAATFDKAGRATSEASARPSAFPATQVVSSPSFSKMR